MFKIFDYSKDEQLDIQEFDNMCQQIGISLAESEVREAFHKFDINESGIVTIDEFVYTIKTYKNKKSEIIDKPFDLGLMITDQYDIVKDDQLKIYKKHSQSILFNENVIIYPIII